MTQSPTDKTVEAVALKPFEREERFIVIKRKDLSLFQSGALWELMECHRIKSVDAVVVERDWPEYETVWQMIEARVTRASIPASPPSPASNEPVCKGSWVLGTACGKCARCKATKPSNGAMPAAGTGEVGR